MNGFLYGVALGAFIGLPPSLVETYGSDVKKVYQANGIPLYLGLVTMFLSAFVHPSYCLLRYCLRRLCPHSFHLFFLRLPYTSSCH